MAEQAPHALGSAFVELETAGDLTVPLIDSDDRRGNVVGAFAFATGREIGTGVARGYAALQPDASVTAAPSGSATYDAAFEGAIINKIVVTDDTLEGSNSLFSGNITLTAQFDDGTLSGNSDSEFNNGLMVAGQITDQELTGNVMYRGVHGELTGLIGGDQVIGAFHGSSEDTVYAGGFVGPVSP